MTPAVTLTFLIPLLFLLPSDNSSRFALGKATVDWIIVVQNVVTNAQNCGNIAGSLEAAYSLNWGSREIWVKGGGETLALL